MTIRGRDTLFIRHSPDSVLTKPQQRLDLQRPSKTSGKESMPTMLSPNSILNVGICSQPRRGLTSTRPTIFSELLVVVTTLNRCFYTSELVEDRSSPNYQAVIETYFGSSFCWHPKVETRDDLYSRLSLGLFRQNVPLLRRVLSKPRTNPATETLSTPCSKLFPSTSPWQHTAQFATYGDGRRGLFRPDDPVLDRLSAHPCNNGRRPRQRIYP